MDVQLHIMERKQNEISGLLNHQGVIYPSRPRPVMQPFTLAIEISLAADVPAIAKEKPTILLRKTNNTMQYHHHSLKDLSMNTLITCWVKH
jgi:hypothetical protein